MERREFAQKLIALGACPFMISNFDGLDVLAKNDSQEDDNPTKILKSQKEFVENWLSDLLDSMENIVDRETQVKIVEGCGKQCFNRHQFKKDIAAFGNENLEKLIEAYSKNFEIWRKEDKVHIRYGEVSKHKQLLGAIA